MKTLILVFLLSCQAQASYLRMIGSHQLKITETKEGLSLDGTYEIHNQGDEASLNVYVRFQIDHFILDTEKRNLKANEKTTWQVHAKIPNEKLCLQVSGKCPVKLGKKGDIALRIDRNYSDTNSYPFSAPDVLILSSDDVPADTNRGMILVTVEPQANQEFKTEFDVKNMTDELIRVEIQPILSEQMQQLTPIPPYLDIGPRAGLLSSFSFKNLKATSGSNYLIPVVARWLESSGRRRAVARFGSVKIYDKASAPKNPKDLSYWNQVNIRIDIILGALKTDSVFWGSWMAMFTLGLILINWWWVQPLKRLKKK